MIAKWNEHVSLFKKKKEEGNKEGEKREAHKRGGNGTQGSSIMPLGIYAMHKLKI